MSSAEIVIIAAIVSLVGFDIYVAVKGELTITNRVRYYAKRYPSVPLLFGYLMGHFFGGW